MVESAIQVTVVGMTVVIGTLTLLAVVVWGMGRLIGDREPVSGPEAPAEARADAGPRPGTPMSSRRMAAAIAAALAVATESSQSASTEPRPASAWAERARAQGALSRLRFYERKEHRSWRGNSG